MNNPTKSEVTRQSPKKADLTKYQMVMMGITKKGPTILALKSNFTI